jgi:hypothetical protein
MPTLLSFVRRTAFHRLSTSDLRAELRNVQLSPWWQGLSLRIRHQREQHGRSKCPVTRRYTIVALHYAIRDEN